MTTPRYGYSTNVNGGVLHRLLRVEVRNGRTGARWACMNGERGVKDAAFTDDPTGFDWCAACEIDQPTLDRSERLYVIRCADHVKVGFSRDPRGRARTLKGELIGTAPGDLLAERRMLRAITATPVQGKERFPLDAEAECLAVMHAVSGTALTADDYVAHVRQVFAAARQAISA